MQRDIPPQPNLLINPDAEALTELTHRMAGGAALFCIMEDGSPATLPDLGECPTIVAQTYKNGRSTEPEVIQIKGLEGGARFEAIQAGLAAAWMRLEIDSLRD